MCTRVRVCVRVSEIRARLRHRGTVVKKVNIVSNARQLDFNFAVNI